VGVQKGGSGLRKRKKKVSLWRVIFRMTSRNTDLYTTKDTDLIDERGTFIVIYNGSKNEKRGCIIGSAPPSSWSMYTHNSLRSFAEPSRPLHVSLLGIALCEQSRLSSLSGYLLDRLVVLIIYINFVK
jgi:hypothetical protein